MPKMNKGMIQARCKALAEGKRQVELIMSTSNLDRDKDTLDAQGCKYEKYMNNAVVLKDHRWNVDSIVAKCIKIYIEENKVIGIVEFPEEGLIPESDKLYKMIQAGLINAVSVGYIMKKYMRNDFGGLDISEWEILEVSFVAIGANSDAGVSAKGAENDSDIEDRITKAVSTALEPVLKKLEELENEKLAQKIAEEMGINE